jgi:hypothetical protein
MDGKPFLETPFLRLKPPRPAIQRAVSGGLIMRLLSLVLSAIGLLVVGAVLCACMSVILGWPGLLRPIVLVAWGGIWRLGILAIALFILMTLIESLRS